MRFPIPHFLAASLLLWCWSAGAQEASIDIPYQKFVLSNGLTVLVHEDHKAPIVAVNVWYHVGSKNERPGRTGFAHLFEHLMFNGSEHFNQDYFKVLEKLGATDLNGTTNNDRTNYFQNAPTSALDTVLWMESDRMGHLLGAIDQAKLDEQRGVVQNEKRQGENQPYGLVYNLLTENTYPPGHPYCWTVIGSMEDLSAASLKDAQEWFKTYYGPSNATMVLAGDIDAKTAREKVEKYFGAIPPGPPVAKHRAWIAKRQGSHREVLQDRVPQARIYKVWNAPQANTDDAEYLGLAAAVLGQGRTSRLYRRLVYTDQVATDASAGAAAREIAGQFQIQATARPGGDLAKVEKAIDEELQKFLAGGPTSEELQRVKTRSLASFLRGLERVGGFGGKSDVLASGQVYAGAPEAYKRSLDVRQRATVEDVKAAANRWLSDGVFVLEVRPFPAFKAAGADVDRSKVPPMGTPPELKLPKLQRATLRNGLKVILAERHEIPVVNFELAVDAGYAADQSVLPGTARLALSMLNEGTKSRTSFQISEELDGLGARLSANSNLDLSLVSLSALKSNLDRSLEIFADVVLNPSFPEQDFKREQKLLLAAIQREKAQPMTIGLRVLPGLLYGKGHAYGNPLTGSGAETSVTAMTRESLVKFYQAWFKPNNAALVVVGDITLAEITPKLENLFASWKPGEVPKKNIGAVGYQPRSVVYLIDKPGAIQSNILVGQIAPPKANPDELAIETLNTLLGEMFVSRINMNLREDKHWTYGARSVVVDARGQRPFVAFAPVQSDKTKEAAEELLKELRGPLGDRPVTADELSMAQDNRTLSLPGSRETSSAVAASILDMVQFGLPDDYYETYAGKVRALKTQDLTAAARKLIHADGLIWVIVGDRAQIEAPLRQANLGEIRFIDADGNPVK
jgi:zinc protease